MKIAKAMKFQARLKGEISRLNDRIAQCVSTNVENDYPENLDTLMTERDSKVTELLKLKSAVMATNIREGIFIKIIELSELKNKIELFRDMTIKVGVCHDRYGEDKGQTFKSQISVAKRNEIMTDLQNQINDITDELDIFNATHEAVI